MSHFKNCAYETFYTLYLYGETKGNNYCLVRYQQCGICGKYRKQREEWDWVDAESIYENYGLGNERFDRDELNEVLEEVP
jgi:hypothetical protein